MVTQLEEQSRQINDAIDVCSNAIETGDVSTVPDTALRIKPEFRDAQYRSVGLVNGNSKKQVCFSVFNFKYYFLHFQNGFGSDPLSKNPSDTSTAFGGEDLFKDGTLYCRYYRFLYFYLLFLQIRLIKTVPSG